MNILSLTIIIRLKIIYNQLHIAPVKRLTMITFLVNENHYKLHNTRKKEEERKKKERKKEKKRERNEEERRENKRKDKK